jgi:hypothetical protein
MLKQLLLAALLGWLLASSTGGSCALRPYEFQGTVQRQCNGPAVPNARVFVFLDDQDGTLAAGAQTRYPDFFVTDKRGNFAAKAWFDTFASYDQKSGHRCDRIPSRVEVIITRPRYLTKRATFNLTDLKSREAGETQVFDLPAIQLEPCQGQS